MATLTFRLRTDMVDSVRANPRKHVSRSFVPSTLQEKHIRPTSAALNCGNELGGRGGGTDRSWPLPAPVEHHVRHAFQHRAETRDEESRDSLFREFFPRNIETHIKVCDIFWEASRAPPLAK